MFEKTPGLTIDEFREKYPSVKTLSVRVDQKVFGNSREDYPSREYPYLIGVETMTEDDFSESVFCSLHEEKGSLRLSNIISTMIQKHDTHHDFDEQCSGRIIPKIGNFANLGKYAEKCSSHFIGSIDIVYAEK